MLQSRELMEEFRGLLNLEVPERKLLSFVFFGLPEVEQSLKLDPPLQQRVAMRYRLEPLGESDTAAYIQHRLGINIEFQGRRTLAFDLLNGGCGMLNGVHVLATPVMMITGKVRNRSSSRTCLTNRNPASRVCIMRSLMRRSGFSAAICLSASAGSAAHATR